MWAMTSSGGCWRREQNGYTGETGSTIVTDFQYQDPEGLLTQQLVNSVPKAALQYTPDLGWLQQRNDDAGESYTPTISADCSMSDHQLYRQTRHRPRRRIRLFPISTMTTAACRL